MKHKIAVCGTGKVSRTAATSLIEDLHNALNEDTQFLILLSETQSESALHTGEWAEDFDLQVTAVSSISDLSTRQEEIWEYAQKNMEIKKPSDIVNLLGPNDHLVVAFDEDDTDTMKIVSRALQKGLSVRDLTMGLSPIVLDDSDPEDDDDDEDDDDEIQDTFELITESNPLVEIRKTLTDLIAKIDAIEERKTTKHVLAN